MGRPRRVAPARLTQIALFLFGTLAVAVSAAATAAAGRLTGAGTAGGLPAENQISAADNIQSRRGANDNNNNRFRHDN